MSSVRGQFIQSALARKSLKKGEVADRAGLSSSQLSQIISGYRRRLDQETADRLSIALGVPQHVLPGIEADVLQGVEKPLDYYLAEAFGVDQSYRSGSSFGWLSGSKLIDELEKGIKEFHSPDGARLTEGVAIDDGIVSPHGRSIKLVLGRFGAKEGLKILDNKTEDEQAASVTVQPRSTRLLGTKEFVAISGSFEGHFDLSAEASAHGLSRGERYPVATEFRGPIAFPVRNETEYPVELSAGTALFSMKVKCATL